jgi:hypothetical protein
MYELKNKTILILSPQSWGTMFLSKHHYAVALANLGNTVYFLNPPAENLDTENIQVRNNSGIHNLLIIDHRLKFPYNLKFHAAFLFRSLMKAHVNAVLKKINKPVDLIWSFDLGNLYPLTFFKNVVKVFHPVDEPLNQTALDAAKGCDIIFSVTKEILNKYSSINVPGYFINHGVADHFLAEMKVPANDSGIHVGIAGNFTRPDIDRTTLLQIIKQNPDILFECWGSYEAAQSNLGGSSDVLLAEFIHSLRSLKNVLLHGPVLSVTLAREFKRMDAFLICYDITKDQSGGTNYHKILEYASTGKVIVSNNVTTYQQEPGILEMITSRTNNGELPGLFKKVIQNLDQYNSQENQKRRVAFATDNTYLRQLSKIEKKLNQLKIHEQGAAYY